MVLVAEDYEGLNRSQVRIKRGNEIAEQLRARGFDVIFVANPTNTTARARLHDLSAKVSGADLSLAVLIGNGTASGDQTFFAHQCGHRTFDRPPYPWSIDRQYR
jgi:hypothetical protein